MIVGSVYHEIEELKEQLNAELKLARSAAKEKSDGFIITTNRGKNRDYLLCKNKNGNKNTRRINSDTVLIKQMLEKRYLKEQIRQLESAISATNFFVENYVDPSHENIRRALLRKYKMIPSEIIRPTSNFVQETEYEQFLGYPERKVHQTSMGFFVRSKSELLIAEALSYANVRYHYEEVFRIGPYELYPDFHCWAKNGSDFYWEHFGMMNDPEYKKRYHMKMKEYEEVGIVPWKNLICTFDQEDGRISMKLINSIINGRLQ